MATTSTPDTEARRAFLLAALHDAQVVRLADAAERLGVSTMTIRRDLEALEDDGHLRRVRGGAVPMLSPQPFRERRAVRQRAKETIAAKALALVPDSGSIALDASTTTGTLALRLGARAGLTVATNSYPTQASLAHTPGVTAILTGGEIEAATDSFVGPIAVRAAEALRYTRLFASASAIDSTHGTSEVSLRDGEVKRAFLRVAGELVLCIDSSKLEQHAVAAGFALAEASVLITELDPADARLDAFRDLVELR